MTKHLHGLYAITNEQLMPEADFSRKAQAALAGGARILQYRDKTTNHQKRTRQATQLKTLCEKYNAVLIINDDINLAKDIDADGVHIGKEDTSLFSTREYLGEDKIIGVSCYDQLSLAETAVNQGANYVAFGSFFGSNIKPDAPKADISLIHAFKSRHAVPICCIGGITTKNYTPLIQAGADMLAVISDIFSYETNEQIHNACLSFADKFPH